MAVLGLALPVLAASAQTSVSAQMSARFTREVDIDRSGNDIRKDLLEETATVDDCERRCAATQGCVAFTFVKRAVTVPRPICWLKSVAPYGHKSSCCISGALVK
jgi:hypothetical protein